MDVNVIVKKADEYKAEGNTAAVLNWINNLQADEYKLSPGGKGMNTACAASLLGSELRKDKQGYQHNVFLCGNVGSDSYGDLLCENMDKYGVQRGLVGVDEKNLTGLANVLKIGSKESKIILQNSVNDFVTAAQTRERFSKFDSSALARGIVCLQLELAVEPNLAALQQAHHFGMSTLLRPVCGSGGSSRLSHPRPTCYSRLWAPCRSRTRCPSRRETCKKGKAARRRTWGSSARCWA